MKKQLIAVFICLVTICVKGQQPNFVKGYVVTIKNDTIRGEVKLNPKKVYEGYLKVVFRDQTGAQKTYKPNKAKAYGYENHHFVGMEIDGEQNFYQVLSKGEINMYKLMFEAMHMNQIVYESEYYISHANNKKLTLIKETKFKKQMADWMKDNQEFVNNYEEEKTFDSEKATEVINQYNAWKATSKE